MEMKVDIKMDLHFEEASKEILEAARLALRDIVIDTAQDSIEGSPAVTGNNRRSIAYQVSGMDSGLTGRGKATSWQRKEVVGTYKNGNSKYGNGESVEVGSVKLEGISGAVWSTSGYGGFLETGTWKMKAQPYMKPAADRNFTLTKFADRMKAHLGES